MIDSLRPSPAAPARPRAPFYPGGPWRWLVPVLLVLLFIAILFWLPWQARQMESNERQEQLIADTLWVEQTIRFELTRNEDALGALATDLQRGELAGPALQARLDQVRKNSVEMLRLTWSGWRGDTLGTSTVDAGAAAGTGVPAVSRDAADVARRTRRARYSEAYAGSGAQRLIDYHRPVYDGERYLGSLVATYDLKLLLDETVPWWFAQDNAISLLDSDDNNLARRAAAGPGRGVYTHKRALDLPGATITLLTDSVKGEPRLLPNLLVGSVVLLALGLVASLLALWRHIARRLAAEGELRQQMAFRTAMENSLVTGLRARDLEGRVTYVNPAFCQIVGLPHGKVFW